MRVNIAISEELLHRVDEAAKALSISRSAYISVALSTKIQQDSLMTDLPKLLKAYEEAKKED